MRASQSRSGPAALPRGLPMRWAPSSAPPATRRGRESSAALVHVVAIGAGFLAGRTLGVLRLLVEVAASGRAQRPEAREWGFFVVARHRQEQGAGEHDGNGPGHTD